MDLNFLKSTPVQAPQRAERTATGPTLVKTPAEGAHLRLFRNGRIYPSEAFAEKYALSFLPLEEFAGADGSVKTIMRGNGLDFFSSDDWTGIETPTTVVFMGVVPRQGNLKIDAFQSTSYNKDDGMPDRTIYDLGANTRMKEFLVPTLETVFDINWEENRYVDIVVREDIQIKSPNDVYHIPKVVQRGEDKGKPTYVRRENIDVFPIQLAEGYVTNADTALAQEVAEAESTTPTDEVPQETTQVETGTPQATEPTTETTTEDRAEALRNTFV